MDSKEDYICLDKNNEEHEIIEKSVNQESTYYIQDYLNCRKDKFAGKFFI